MKRQVGRMMLLLISTMGSIVGSEWYVRHFRPQPTYSRLVRGSLASFTASEFNTYTLKSNFRGVDHSRERPERSVSIGTNSHGLRGPELVPPRKNQILILGDSYTFGVYLDDGETYPAQLQRLLDMHRIEAQVLNAGYAGGSEPDHQYAWFKRIGVGFQPTVTLLGFFLGNDINDIDFTAWRNLDDRGLPTRYEIPDVYVDGAGRLRSRAGDWQSAGVDFFYRAPILRESHLFIVLGKVVDRFLLRRRAGYAEESFAHIFGDFSADFLEKERVAIDLIEGMKATAASAGSEFAVILIPINFMVDRDTLRLVIPARKGRTVYLDYYERFAAFLQRRGIASVNIGAAMRRSATEGPFFPSDGEVHFNARGARFTAERIFEFLHSENLLR